MKTLSLSLVIALILVFEGCAEEAPPFEVSSTGYNFVFDADSLKKTGRSILINNWSFEFVGDYPQSGFTPFAWINMFEGNGETPPDIQPGNFHCARPPSEGKTYLGMVVRDNNTWESIGQYLSYPLKIDSAYLFSLDLSKSPFYIASSRSTMEITNYNTPCVLKIYGAINHELEEKELLAASPAISDTVWKRYDFVLKPKRFDSWMLILELDYKKGSRLSNGNMLLDNCSQIYELSGN